MPNVNTPNKEELREQIDKLWSEILVWAAEAGIRRKNLPINSRWHYNDLSHAAAFLRRIIAGPIARIREVRKMVPESAWAQYKLLEIEELTEQTLFKDALLKLKKEWDEGYVTGFSRKNDRDAQQPCEGAGGTADAAE